MKFDANRQELMDRVGPQLLNLFDLLPDVSFFMKDRQGRFTALNRSGCEYCGVPSEREALGKTDRDFFPAERAAKYRADDQAVMRTGRAILNRIEPAPELEGSPRLVVTNKIPLRDEEGKVIGVAGFSRRVEQVRCAASAQRKLAKTIEHLHEHHSETLQSSELARMAGMSLSQFERTFRKTFGTSPRQYLLRVRVESASRKLVESDETVATIAQECGFYDHAHFTRAFTVTMGINPSRYRSEKRLPKLSTRTVAGSTD